MNDKTIALKSYDNLASANLDSAVLIENGIPSFVRNEAGVKMYSIFQDADYGLKVFVYEKDRKKALELLEEYHSAEIVSSEE
jgi:hypothetical protein